MQETSEMKAWVADAISGDTKAFDKLMLATQRGVASTVRRYVFDPGDAEDVTQETLLRAYVGIDKFRGDSSFFSWVHRIATTTSLNYLELRKRRTQGYTVSTDVFDSTDAVDSLIVSDDPQDVLAAKQTHYRITRGLRRLSPQQCDALTLREYHGVRYEDVARILQVPIGTVRSQISRARSIIEMQINDPEIKLHKKN